MRVEKKCEIRECGPRYTGLLSRHSKCMQSYSCAAAPLIHTDAQALTDASVSKCQIDMLTWGVYWLHSRVGWLLSKVLILLDMPSRGYPCILGLFSTLRMSWDFSAFKWKKWYLHVWKMTQKKVWWIAITAGDFTDRLATCALLRFSSIWITIDSEST